jgi:site-specific DNA-cytosine methylase
MIAEIKRSTLSVAVAASLKTFEAVTKQIKLLKVGKSSSKRKLVISTNWLDKFRFKKGVQTVEEVIGAKQGLRIRLATYEDTKTKLVYERSYSTRANETQIDARHQGKLDEALGEAEEVHITFSQGLLTILPVFANKKLFIHDPVRLVLEAPKEIGELDTTIFNALEFIEQAQARKLVIDYGDVFANSDQKVLLDLQLRRLGYSVSSDQVNRKSMKATMMPESDDPNDIARVQSTVINCLTYDSKHHQEILDNIDTQRLKDVFFAASSGVDISAMEAHEFKGVALNEWRPHEERDISKKTCKKTGQQYEHINDKSESGAVCAALNSKDLRFIFNEDIYKLDITRNIKYLSRLTGTGIYHASFACDDFSTCKNNKDKAKSLVKLDSTIDMFMPALRDIKLLKPAMISIENVPGYAKSTSCLLFQAKLKSMGYDVHMKVLNALDYNGSYSSRKRMMLFATVLDADFSFPESEERKSHLWNDIISKNLNRFRDVSHTKGIASYKRGRAISHSGVDKNLLTKPEKTLLRKFQCANVVKFGDSYCGTILKSQNRQVAESLILELNNKFLFPDNEICKLIMGIDPTFDVGKPFTQEIGAEIIGQSIDVSMHKRFCESIDKHINEFIQRSGKLVNMASSAFLPQPDKKASSYLVQF